jgi:hypothetical protein
MIRQMADHFVFRFNAEWGEELLHTDTVSL